MANTAARLIQADLVFGNINNNTVFVASNTRISASESQQIDVHASAINLLGNTTVTGTLSISQGITAPTFQGTAQRAHQLTTARTIALGGDASGSVSFNGTGNVTITTEIQRVRGISFRANASNPSGSSRLAMDGEFYATRVHNAVWNDLVDFIEIEKDTPIEYGRVYIKTNDLTVQRATKYRQKGIIGIASDTYGLSMGQDSKKSQIPIAIGGFVLAHVDDIYQPGTPLTTNYTGGLTKASLLTRLLFPERIVATFYQPELQPIWNEQIDVNSRSWVKVR